MGGGGENLIRNRGVGKNSPETGGVRMLDQDGGRWRAQGAAKEDAPEEKTQLRVRRGEEGKTVLQRASREDSGEEIGRVMGHLHTGAPNLP